MVLLFIFITIVYLLLIGSLIFGFDKIEAFNLSKIPPKTTFSIIIPFRNEAENLTDLLSSLKALEYNNDLFEVILVDDESSDNSSEIIKPFISKTKLNITLIKNKRQTHSPKKDAITSAIQIAKHEWIITTDADCILPIFWLSVFDNFIQKKQPSFIVAPVTYTKADSFLKRFQLLDFLSLQGATIGGFGLHKPFLCNGANLAYKKALFISLNGFDGNTNIASGDDIFMLEKALNKSTESVQYIKDEHAIVYSKAQSNISDLIAQRKRWASKTSTIKSKAVKCIGLTILFMNASLICLLFLNITSVISVKVTLYVLMIKLSIDFLLLYKTARFFKQEHYLLSYLFCALLYPFFSVYIGFASMFTSYKWKDRAFVK